MNYSFLHVNYNNSGLTINCIESIYLMNQYSKLNFKIIIIDNNSNSDEREILKLWENSHLSSNIIFLYLNENLGYFKAFNEGFKYLNHTDRSSYVIIGNNDLKFDKTFISRLNSQSYNNDVFVIAPNIINKDGLHQNPHLIKRFSFLRLTFYKLYYLNYYFAITLSAISDILSLRSSKKNKAQFDINGYITMGFGACFVLTPSFFTHFHKLDDYLFLMGEEGMLANQILEVGGRTFYDSSLIVYHDDHATFKKIPSRITYKHSKKSYYIAQKHYKLSQLSDPLIH